MYKLLLKLFLIFLSSFSFLFGLSDFSKSIKKVQIATFYTYNDIDKFFNKYYDKFETNNLLIPLYLTKKNKYYVLYTYMSSKNELKKIKNIINNVIVFSNVNSFPFINKNTIIFIYSKNNLNKYNFNIIKGNISQLNIKNKLKEKYLNCYKNIKIVKRKLITIPLKCLNFIYPLKDKNKNLIKINFNDNKFYKIFLIKKEDNDNITNIKSLQSNINIKNIDKNISNNKIIKKKFIDSNLTTSNLTIDKRNKEDIQNILNINNLKVKNFVSFIENNIKEVKLKKNLIGIKNLPFDKSTFVFDKDIKTIILKAAKNKEHSKNIQKQNNNDYKNKINRKEKEDFFISISKTLYTILLIIINIFLFIFSIIILFKMDKKGFKRLFKGNVNDKDKEINQNINSNINKINNDINKRTIENEKIEQDFDFGIKEENNNINKTNNNINKETIKKEQTKQDINSNIKEKNNNINETNNDIKVKNNKQKQIEELKSLLKKPKIKRIRK